MTPTNSDSDDDNVPNVRSSLRLRLVIAILFVIAAVTFYLTNSILMERFSQSTANRAELRLALYGGNLKSELQRNSIVPQLLARDQSLITALELNDFSKTSQRLISFLDEINAASLSLLDVDGRTVASTERHNIAAAHREKAYFVDAMRSNETVFSVVEKESGGFGFYYAKRLEAQNAPLGVILVEVDLLQFERAWAGIADAVFVSDSSGVIVLSTEPRWRGLTEEEALTREPAESAIDRALRFTADWAGGDSQFDSYFQGRAVMRQQGRLGFQGWQITNFTAYSTVRERINAILAFEIMLFALIFAAGFYFLNRRNTLRLVLFQRESEDLRALNQRLQREIAERKKVEENLQVAEQSLAQSSKLAALGEMSAAVSHELNQPLAAMKTYLAGAGLLLRRNRPDEALAAFSRIDDLLERMGAITRQLKSYARKGGESFQPVNMADAVSSSLAMMDPQLQQHKVRLSKVISDQDALVMGDRMRIEQVLINLIRNAIDAIKTVKDPEIEIILSTGQMISLTVRDNGFGIADLDDLFEPFYTTKQAGEGTGLGLAISSGIINDMGGRLMARNSDEGGAVFEVILPPIDEYNTGKEPFEAAE
jgi:two-component system C4-dicarboxylate transport sensor histidine kinase DctB